MAARRDRNHALRTGHMTSPVTMNWSCRICRDYILFRPTATSGLSVAEHDNALISVASRIKRFLLLLLLVHDLDLIRCYHYHGVSEVV